MQAKLIVGWRIDEEKCLAYARANQALPDGLCITRLSAPMNSLFLTLSYRPKVNFDWATLQREIEAVDWVSARRLALLLGGDDVPFQIIAEPALRSQYFINFGELP